MVRLCELIYDYRSLGIRVFLDLLVKVFIGTRVFLDCIVFCRCLGDPRPLCVYGVSRVCLDKLCFWGAPSVSVLSLL